MKEPFFSIIVPMYNSEETIIRCVNSIVINADEDIEIICVDDGSYDRTLDLISVLCNKYPFIHRISGKHEGVSAARNKGIDCANGKYFMFVDADDCVCNNIFKTLKVILSDVQWECVTFGGFTIGNSDRAKILEKQLNLPETIYMSKSIVEQALYDIPSCNLFIWNKVFLSKIIRENNIRFDESIQLGEDRAFIFDYFLNIQSLLSLSEKYYVYTADQKSSITNSLKNKSYVKACSHLKVAEHVFQSWTINCEVDFEVLLRMINWMLHYVYRPETDKYDELEKQDIKSKFNILVKKYCHNVIYNMDANIIYPEQNTFPLVFLG